MWWSGSSAGQSPRGLCSTTELANPLLPYLDLCFRNETKSSISFSVISNVDHTPKQDRRVCFLGESLYTPLLGLSLAKSPFPKLSKHLLLFSVLGHRFALSSFIPSTLRMMETSLQFMYYWEKGAELGALGTAWSAPTSCVTRDLPIYLSTPSLHGQFVESTSTLLTPSRHCWDAVSQAIFLGCASHLEQSGPWGHFYLCRSLLPDHCS